MPSRVRRKGRTAPVSANAIACLVALAVLAGLIAAGSSSAAVDSACRSVDATHAGRWAPGPTTAAWQWQLQGKVDTDVSACVDEVDGFETSKATVTALHRNGVKVICYLDVGSWEEYRPDAGQFPKSVLGNVYEGFPEERWLDIRQFHKFAPIMEKRIAMCARKGFDGVEPDNIAGWENKTGFPLTRADQRRYNLWIARQVHKRGMAVALKNDPKQAKELLGAFDFAVVEECFQYDECASFKPFIAAGQAVFEAEYELPPSKFCAEAKSLGFSAIRKGLELFAKPWEPCEPLG